MREEGDQTPRHTALEGDRGEQHLGLSRIDHHPAVDHLDGLGRAPSDAIHWVW